MFLFTLNRINVCFFLLPYLTVHVCKCAQSPVCAHVCAVHLCVGGCVFSLCVCACGRRAITKKACDEYVEQM